MNKTLVTACLVMLCLAFCNAQTTDSLLGPRVWLSADRSSLTSNKWSDLSFFKNDATGVSAVSTPSTYSSINFNKALIFDGVNDYLKIPYSLEGLAELSILSVFESADTTERGIWGAESSLSRNILLTTRRSIGPDTIADEYGNYGKKAILNSVLQNWNKATTTSSTAFMALGSAGVSKEFKPFSGSIAELLVFDRALTPLERVQYETYLAIKYGTSLTNGNFVSSGEKLLWHVQNNAAYGQNIAGIGRDDFFKLYQKQSGSAYDSGLLVMSVGTLAASNSENSGSINNQDFILWGDNGSTLTTKPGIGPDSVLSLIQRKWLVAATSQTAKSITTDLHIDVNKLPADPLGYWLVIDRSGQGNFSVDNLEYILPEGIVNGKVVYKNVTWDKDGSGKDNFGFARARKLLAVIRQLNHPTCINTAAGKLNLEVIGGKAPYSYKLTTDEGTVAREWKQSTSIVEQTDLTKGNYTLLLEDATGESLSRKFTLSMPDALTIDLGADRKFSTTEPIVLDVSAQVPDTVNVSYRWENSFGFSSTEKRITVTEPGVYRVFVTKQKDGCVFTDEVNITGAEVQRVAVYPTVLQADQNYNVSISLEQAGVVNVKVFNSRGINITDLQGKGNSEYQFTAKLKDSGLYIVLIQTPKGMETHKIIVY